MEQLAATFAEWNWAAMGFSEGPRCVFLFSTSSIFFSGMLSKRTGWTVSWFHSNQFISEPLRPTHPTSARELWHSCTLLPETANQSWISFHMHSWKTISRPAAFCVSEILQTTTYRRGRWCHAKLLITIINFNTSKVKRETTISFTKAIFILENVYLIEKKVQIYGPNFGVVMD